MTLNNSMTPVVSGRSPSSGLAGFAAAPAVSAASDSGSSASSGGVSGFFAELMASLSQYDGKGGSKGDAGSPGAGSDNRAGFQGVDGEGLSKLAEDLLRALGAENPASPEAEAMLDELKSLAEAMSDGEVPARENLDQQQQAWLALLEGLQSAGYSRGSGPFSVSEGFAKAVELVERRFPGSLQGVTRGDSPREFLSPQSAQTPVQRSGEPASATRVNSVVELLNGFVGQQGENREVASRPGSLLVSGAELRTDSNGQVSLAGQTNRTVATEWAPVRVNSSHGQWARDLASALGDRLSMQINQQVREATVRLDPPELGKIELVVRMDGDRLNVQINASNAGVRDMLTQHAERLRADLLAQNLQTVDVHVGSEGQQRDPRHGPTLDTMIASNSGADEEAETPLDTDEDERWLSTSA